MIFFTMFHTPGEGGAPNLNGVGPLNNQPACIGCHLNPHSPDGTMFCGAMGLIMV
jgi:hypothetical protein